MFLGSLSQFGTTYTNLRCWLVPSWLPNMMHRWHVQEFQVLRVLGPALRMKAQTDSNSRGQTDFIFRKEKECILGNAGGPGNWWSHGWGWGVEFYSLFLHCLRVEMPFRCSWAFPREEKCLLDLPQSVLHKDPASQVPFVRQTVFSLTCGLTLLLRIRWM
jgi:hypothetical protein